MAERRAASVHGPCPGRRSLLVSGIVAGGRTGPGGTRLGVTGPGLGWFWLGLVLAGVDPGGAGSGAPWSWRPDSGGHGLCLFLCREGRGGGQISRGTREARGAGIRERHAQSGLRQILAFDLMPGAVSGVKRRRFDEIEKLRGFKNLAESVNGAWQRLSIRLQKELSPERGLGPLPMGTHVPRGFVRRIWCC